MLRATSHTLSFTKFGKATLMLPDGWKPLDLRGSLLYIIADYDNPLEEEEFVTVHVAIERDLHHRLGEAEGLYIGAISDDTLVFLAMPQGPETMHQNSRDIELPKNFTTPANKRG